MTTEFACRRIVINSTGNGSYRASHDNAPLEHDNGEKGFRLPQEPPLVDRLLRGSCCTGAGHQALEPSSNIKGGLYRKLNQVLVAAVFTEKAIRLTYYQDWAFLCVFEELIGLQ